MAQSDAIPWTAEQLEGGIANALKAHDVDAAVDMLKVLVAVDARRAEEIYETMQLGITIAHYYFRSTPVPGTDPSAAGQTQAGRSD